MKTIKFIIAIISIAALIGSILLFGVAGIYGLVHSIVFGGLVSLASSLMLSFMFISNIKITNNTTIKNTDEEVAN